MAELKGVKKLDKKVSKFTEKFGCTAEMGSEFCYWKGEDLINYSLLVGLASDGLWREYVLKNFNYKIENIFMFSLLHEIGHHLTMDNFSKKMRNAEAKKVEKIEEKLNESDSEIVFRNSNLEYFDLPMERVATKWAVNFSKKHRRFLKRFWKSFQKDLYAFYALNGIKLNLS